MAAGLPGAGRAPLRQWTGPELRLGHVPLSPGFHPTTMPASDDVAQLTVVGDIRLDNRAELSAALGLGGGPAGKLGDPELVLAAYRRWGEGCAERLLGDFSFALWNGRRRFVFCARDPLGTKPLYYHLTSSTFAFASDPEAILRLPDVPRRLNRLALAEYLFACYDDVEATAWLDVSRLPPGSTLTVATHTVKRRRTWHPESVPELQLDSDAAYEDAFRTALTDAVRQRLPARGAGVYLSGGLDSSAVTSVAQPLYRGGRLATFTAVFDADADADERVFADATSARAGADAHHVRPESFSPLGDWVAAPWAGPAPSCDPQVTVVRAVVEGAGARGTSVLLSGLGGDSVVSHGVAYLTELAGSGHPVRFLAEARALARRHDRALTPLVRTYGVRPFVPPAVLRRRGRRQNEDFRIGAVSAPVRSDVVRDLGLEERVAARGRSRPARTSRQAHLRELTSGHPPYAFEGDFHTDVVTGVERRYPFVDRRLAELCLSMPGDQKLRDGWTRSIMRRAMADVLPEVVHQRPGKGDLAQPFRRSLLDRDRPALEALVASPGLVTEWVDPAALRALWDRCQSEQRGQDCFSMWRVAVLSRWLAHHGFG